MTIIKEVAKRAGITEPVKVEKTKGDLTTKTSVPKHELVHPTPPTGLSRQTPFWQIFQLFPLWRLPDIKQKVPL